MKPLMLVPPAQAEALYDTHLDAPEDRHLGDRFARLPWVDEDSTEDSDLSRLTVPTRSQERLSVQRRAA